MATSKEWAIGYSRQAQADFMTWQKLEENPDIPSCHRMLFLQMACEKLCKARLIHGGTPPAALQSSHGYVANPLPIVIRSQLEFMGQDLRKQAGLLTFARHLANEIEILNPAMKRDDLRPDNCEYPWEDAGRTLHSPLDWDFAPSLLLQGPLGPRFVKVLQLAISRIVDELT